MTRKRNDQGRRSPKLNTTIAAIILFVEAIAGAGLMSFVADTKTTRVA